MRINDSVAARLKELGVELRQGVSLTGRRRSGLAAPPTKFLLRRFETIPEVMRLLADENIRFVFSAAEPTF